MSAELETLLRNVIADNKKRQDNARADTQRLCELNSLLIYKHGTEQADRLQNAIDRMLGEIVKAPTNE